MERVADSFRMVHDAAVAVVGDEFAGTSVYAYGSVVTGQARIGISDVDLLTIGLKPTDARHLGEHLSMRFAETCRSVEIAAADGSDFVGDTDEAYGNRVFLRHYCVLLAGPDSHRTQQDFPGDRRAARGFNGDIARHAAQWGRELESGSEAPGILANRIARKSLLAVAGLVSVRDGTWTTDRATSADRWAEIMPELRSGLSELLSWASTPPEPSVETVRGALEGTVSPIVAAFRELIGLWPDLPSRRDAE